VYVSATRKFFLVAIAVGAMVLGYHGWGVEGFAAGAVIAGVFLLWFGRRTRTVYRTRASYARQLAAIDPDIRERAGRSSGFEWDPTIKVPLGDNATSWRVDQKPAASQVDEDQKVA
jgi:hypothetical protein